MARKEKIGKGLQDTGTWGGVGEGADLAKLQMGFPRAGSLFRGLVLSRFSRVRHPATLWTVACQAPLSMGFSRQAYWSGLPGPPPGDSPTPGIDLVFHYVSCIAGGFFTTRATWEAPIPICREEDKGIVWAEPWRAPNLSPSFAGERMEDQRGAGLVDVLGSESKFIG